MNVFVMITVFLPKLFLCFTMLALSLVIPLKKNLNWRKILKLISAKMGRVDDIGV